MFSTENKGQEKHDCNYTAKTFALSTVICAKKAPPFAISRQIRVKKYSKRFVLRKECWYNELI